MGWDELFQVGAKYAAQYVMQELTTRRQRDDDDRPRGVFAGNYSPESPEPPASTAGCPVCKLHQDAAEARGLLEGLAIECRNGQSIPKGLGGTLTLARAGYGKAESYLKSVAISAPFLRDDCADLARAAASMEQQLSEQISPDMLDTISIKATRYWSDTYKLAVRFYTEPQIVRR